MGENGAKRKIGKEEIARPTVLPWSSSNVLHMCYLSFPQKHLGWGIMSTCTPSLLPVLSQIPGYSLRKSKAVGEAP